MPEFLMDEFEDSLAIDGPLAAFLPSIDAPLISERGHLNCVVRVSRIDLKTNTIWLESAPNA